MMAYDGLIGRDRYQIKAWVGKCVQACHLIAGPCHELIGGARHTAIENTIFVNVETAMNMSNEHASQSMSGL